VIVQYEIQVSVFLNVKKNNILQIGKFGASHCDKYSSTLNFLIYGTLFQFSALEEMPSVWMYICPF
jgi:hypothetical protein